MVICQKHLVVYTIFQLTVTSFCNEHVITLYAWHQCTGLNENITVSNCSSIPSNFTSSRSAINHYKCTRLYLNEHCSGSFVTVLPNIPVSNFSTAWGDKSKFSVSSAGPCPNSCDIKTRRNYLQEGVVKIYQFTYQNGFSKEISVKGCTRIPRDFVDNFGSIHAYNQCIQFYNTENCNLNSQDAVTVEMGLGTPYHHNIYAWNLPIVKAISFCSFKCSQEEILHEAQKSQLVLYTAKNFGGNLIKLNVIHDSCAIIPDELSKNFYSLKVGEETCVIFFSEDDCVGTSYSLNRTLTDLHSWTKNKSTKSYRSCIEIEKRTVQPKIFPTAVSTPVSIESKLTSKYVKPTFYTFVLRNISQIHTKFVGQENEWPLYTISFIVAGLLMAFIVFFILFMCHKNIFISCQGKVDNLTEKEIQEFFAGIDNSATSVNSEVLSTEALAQMKSYNNIYEVARSKIEYNVEALTEKSEFIVAYRGTMSNLHIDQNIDVTVNTSNPTSGLLGIRSLLKEVKVMLYLGEHTNIVHLVGCCTENLRQGKFLVLMECCRGGSLKCYLNTNHAEFNNLLVKGNILLNGITIDVNTTELNCVPTFDTKLLIQWCIDVCRGMEFLSNAKIVHSDLATRNILLTEKLQAKISDYGLCRQLNSYSRYVNTEQEAWRWNSLESLKRLEFTTMSDVWSYGVVCWEIFTLGDKPYHNIEFKEQLVNNLEEGLGLANPSNATETLYVLMLKCWENDPCKRPSFAEMREILQQIIQKTIN